MLTCCPHDGNDVEKQGSVAYTDVYKKPLCMQNPVMSAAWLVANLQLLAPLLSLTLDTRRFCEPVLRSRVLAVIAVIYTAMSYVGLVVRPSPKFNLLHLYNFTQTFRIQFGLVAAAAFVAYVAVMQCTRIVLDSHQQRRIQTL